MATLSDNAATALYGACVKRGKAKGLLLRTPPKERYARAAWYGVQSVCNPYKLSISALLFMQEDERAIYHEIEALMEQWKARNKSAVLMDQDRLALECLGAW